MADFSPTFNMAYEDAAICFTSHADPALKTYSRKLLSRDQRHKLVEEWGTQWHLSLLTGKWADPIEAAELEKPRMWGNSFEEFARLASLK